MQKRASLRQTQQQRRRRRTVWRIFNDKPTRQWVNTFCLAHFDSLWSARTHTEPAIQPASISSAGVLHRGPPPLSLPWIRDTADRLDPLSSAAAAALIYLAHFPQRWGPDCPHLRPPSPSAYILVLKSWGRWKLKSASMRVPYYAFFINLLNLHQTLAQTESTVMD
jgi:hypothetical protein